MAAMEHKNVLTQESTESATQEMNSVLESISLDEETPKPKQSGFSTAKGEVKKMFQNAIMKNNVIAKIQSLREEKDVVKDQQLDRASKGVEGLRARFQLNRPNSISDPLDTKPAGGSHSSRLLVNDPTSFDAEWMVQHHSREADEEEASPTLAPPTVITEEYEPSTNTTTRTTTTFCETRGE